MKTKDNTIAILSLAVGVVGSSANSEGSYDVWDIIIGLILFSVLLSYWNIHTQGITKKYAYILLLSCTTIMLLYGIVGFTVKFYELNLPEGHILALPQWLTLVLFFAMAVIWRTIIYLQHKISHTEEVDPEEA